MLLKINHHYTAQLDCAKNIVFYRIDIYRLQFNNLAYV